jgi:transcriptional regulator with XRE-family HTH domain
VSPLHLRLRELRHRRGLSQAELAKRTGLRRATIVALERGQSSPRLTTLEKLATALGVSVVQLLTAREESRGHQKR